jgi:putative redox protein
MRRMTITARIHRAHGALTTLTDGRHAWSADVSQALGSGDAGPDPHDLLDSALAACTALTLELYIRRKQLAVTDLVVNISHIEEKTDAGAVVYRMTRTLDIAGDLSDADRERLREIAGKCPVHKTLTGEIAIETVLASSPPVSAS